MGKPSLSLKTTLALYQGTALAGRSEAAIRAEENV